MPDLYLTIKDQPEEVLNAIATAMDIRAGETAMRDICRAYMTPLGQPDLDLVEVGCGNGATSALMLDILKPKRFIGVDPSPGLIRRAQARFADRPETAFHAGSAENTRIEDASVDLVIAHTVFSHLADPIAALHEAMRILRPGGVLAVFDGDYATNTVALFDGDPLQSAMQAAQRHLIHDMYIMRKLPGLMSGCGFQTPEMEAHGYVKTTQADYMITLMERGVDAAARTGDCGEPLAKAFIEEARRRVEQGKFYGAILFASITARKPAG